MVVSAGCTFLGTKVNPSVRIIHLYEQTKWRVQLQAMLSRKVNEELLVTWALPVAFVIHVRKMLSSNSSYMKKLPNNLLERDAQKARGRFKVRVHQEFIINQLSLQPPLSAALYEIVFDFKLD